MNDKLKQWAPKKYIEESGHGRSGCSTESLVTVTKSEKGKQHCIRFSIHARATKTLGWIPKDQITFEITEQGSIVLFRQPGPKSRTINKAGGSGRTGTRMYLRIPVVKGLYDVFPVGQGREVEIKDGAMAFEI